MATVATLLGLSPAPVQHCRVLELGCAGGSNLIPMALVLPESEFFGIDASGVQIAQGQRAIEAVGLKNITLKHLNMSDVNEDLGQFDYIVAHGVFSWVPEAVRNKILAICKQNLAPNGVAYVSYNTYPGWHMHRTVRDMMVYGTRNTVEPQMRIARARALLDFIADSVATAGVDSVKGSAATATDVSNRLLTEAYAGLLKGEKERLGSSTDSYLFHDALEDENNPIYFHQFAEWAARYGLQYLSEANLSDVFLNDLPSSVTETLLEMSHDVVELEQYMDFLKNRAFRRTLLVHQEVPVSRKLSPDRVLSLYVASNNRPVSSSPVSHSISVEEFSSPIGAKLATDHPVTKAAMLGLADIWPQAVSFDELLEMAYSRLSSCSEHGTARSPADRVQDAQALSASLLQGFAYGGGMVELHVHAPLFSREAGERPVASPWACFQARGVPSVGKLPENEKQQPLTVTNLRHERVELDGLTHYVLSHLDGTHSRDAILEGLAKSVVEGKLVLRPLNGGRQPEGQQQGSEPIADIEQARRTLEGHLDATLRRLARAALLLA